LIDSENNRIICDKEIMHEFVSRGYGKMFKFAVGLIEVEHLKGDISNLFNSFLLKKLDHLNMHLFLTYAHRNNRFRREKEYVLSLIKSGLLGWSEKIEQLYIIFDTYTNRVLEQLCILDDVVMEFNSVTAIKVEATSMLLLRCLNSIKEKLDKVKVKILRHNYQKIISEVEELHFEVLSEVRDEFMIDLPADQKWVLPENPTLEEEFLNLYQNSSIRNGDFEGGLIADTLIELKNNKFVKIELEVEKCIADFVNINDIRDVLRKRRIIL
jgi:hypothetical protein